MGLDVIRGLYVPRGEGNPLHILTYSKQGRWSCHCLEYGLEGDGHDTGTAFMELKRLLGLLFTSPEGRTAGVPAPPSLWRLWDGASEEIPAEVSVEEAPHWPLPGQTAIHSHTGTQGSAA